MSSTENIGVVGAGICGLCTALALSSKGHQVTLYERDQPPPEGGAETAFFEWNRRGASQFRHPHAFLAALCNILEQNYPDLIDRFWAAGARKVSFEDMLRPELLEKYTPEPGDEKLWMLMCRRATMETVLRRYVEERPNVMIRNGISVTGLITQPASGTLSASGIKYRENRGEEQIAEHSIIVDSSGRGSRFPEWLTRDGADIEVETDDAEIVYYTRHYKLNPGEPEPPRHGKERSAGDMGYIKYGVFPGDNGHFAIILCLPNQELALREAVKSSEGFDQICLAIPGLVPWLENNKSSPTTHSFGMGNIRAVWRHFVKDATPVATNFFAVGDSAVRTNPLYGRGCSTGIIHAHLLADVITDVEDPLERAIKFDSTTEQELRPIFKASLTEDRRGIQRAEAIQNGQDLEELDSVKKWIRTIIADAVSAAAREDIRVLRGGMRTFNLMEKPGEFLKDNRIKWTVFKYLFRGRKKNARSRFVNGPDRQEMIDKVSQAESRAA